MQFGKTAAALASLLAAGTCAAAGVKVYGAIDTGLTYKHVAESGGNSLEMTSGNFAGFRLGLKCSEDLGNGLSVGFILENGSSSDSGARSARTVRSSTASRRSISRPASARRGWHR